MTNMAGEIIIREYRGGDEEAIVELLVEIFTEWSVRGSRALDFWKWMYLDNPLGDTIISVATYGGRIISMKHDLLLEIKFGDRIIVGCLGTDSCTDTDFRRRGIYFKLRERKYSLLDNHNAEMTYGITSNPILIKKEAEKDPRFPTNYLFPTRIIKMMWIRDIDIHIKFKPTENAWLKKIGFRTLRLVNKLRYSYRKSHENPGFEIINVKSFGVDIDHFWEKISQQYIFVVKKDREYLNWRYCDPRAGEYRIKMAVNDDEVLGFIVYQVFKYENKYQTGRIIDFLTLPKRDDVGFALVDEALESFEENTVNYVDCLVFRGHSHQKILEVFGFVDRREPIYIRYNLSGKGETSLLLDKSNPEKLHFCHGDLFLT